MPSPLNDLNDYVYKTLLNEEMAKAKRGSNGDNSVFLNGIKSIDKLPCRVHLGLNYRYYEITIKSEDLMQPTGGGDVAEKIYYHDSEFMAYEATKIYKDEVEKKGKVLPGTGYMKIIKKEDVELFINKLIEFLKDLKFNTFRGVFLKYDTPHSMFDAFKCPNIEIVEGEECIVCYERTLVKTWCNHSVCYKCAEQIPSKDIADGSVEKPCPMCRADLIYPE